ncbi:MAG TPA: ABC transporter ATP-binding protein, partial [Clostridia bacterium]|nr:ABC transporter ATP-binding protein [Clostridia bacterium]
MLALSFITPYLFSSIIGYFADGSRELVYRSIVLISAVYLLTIACQSVVFFVELRIEKDTRVSVKKELLKHLLGLHSSNPALTNTAKTTETVYTDTNNVTTMAFSVFSVANDILTVIISGFIIFSISPVLSISMILVLCVTLFSSNKFARILETLNINLRKSTDRNFKLARDIIINMKPIKITNAMWYFSTTFGEDIDKVKGETIKRDKVSWYANIIGSGMENIGMIVFLIVGSYAVFSGHMSLPLFIMFSSYSGLFNAAITRLFKLNANMQQLIISVQRVFDLYELEDEVRVTKKQIEVSEICLADVSFSYRDKPVLDSFSHTFRERACYVIIGHNGSGKTTLLNLLAGVLVPEKGVLSYNQHDFREVSYK